MAGLFSSVDHIVNPELLAMAMAVRTKQAFVPGGDPSMGGAPADPAAGGGGQPMDPAAMDPAAMGGMPPPDPRIDQIMAQMQQM